MAMLNNRRVYIYIYIYMCVCNTITETRCEDAKPKFVDQFPGGAYGVQISCGSSMLPSAASNHVHNDYPL